MAKRSLPPISAAPQADIAFLLLIFYLVSTTMNVESGIQRVLPAWVESNPDEQNKINERNILKVLVNSQDRLAVEDKAADISQLTEIAKEFILNPLDSDDLPVKNMVEVELIGQYPISEGVISLQNTRETTYEMYIKVQNELSRAYREVRDNLSMEKFGRKLADLDSEQAKAIRKAIPVRISEAEPRDLTK
ncbi:MAG: biopolymer transporter ExbD [Rikenellaceae bacterium]